MTINVGGAEQALIESQQAQLEACYEAMETLGVKGFMSFEDRAAFARDELTRIKAMGGEVALRNALAALKQEDKT